MAFVYINTITLQVFNKIVYLVSKDRATVQDCKLTCFVLGSPAPFSRDFGHVGLKPISKAQCDLLVFCDDSLTSKRVIMLTGQPTKCFVQIQKLGVRLCM